jgi:hypothetical protein
VLAEGEADHEATYDVVRYFKCCGNPGRVHGRDVRGPPFEDARAMKRVLRPGGHQRTSPAVAKTKGGDMMEEVSRYRLMLAR